MAARKEQRHQVMYSSWELICLSEHLKYGCRQKLLPELPFSLHSCVAVTLLLNHHLGAACCPSRAVPDCSQPPQAWLGKDSIPAQLPHSPWSHCSSRSITIHDFDPPAPVEGIAAVSLDTPAFPTSTYQHSRTANLCAEGKFNTCPQTFGRVFSL